MLRLSILALAAVFTYSAEPVLAAANTGCSIEMDSSSGQWNIDDIDLFSQQTRVSTFQLQLINTGTNRCFIHLGLDTAGSPFGLLGPDGKRVPYQIIDHDTGKDITPNKGNFGANYPGVLKIEPQASITLNLDFVVFPQLDSDGVYTQSLRISADGEGNDDMHVARVQTLAANVASSASMSLSGSFVPSGGTADIDLGILSGEGPVALPLFLKIRSTRAYRIRATSQNQGKLVLDSANWSIRYRLSINGVEVEPAGGQYLSAPGPYRHLDTVPLGFNIVGSTEVAAGRYSDMITLEISLN